MNCDMHKSNHLVNFELLSILFGTVADHIELLFISFVDDWVI